uniref:NAD(P)H-quinone oxidoreductase chain 4, chloroplastic n=1 Tax=Nephroselmis pyriformis TaxID=156128 RepID=A0A8A2H8S0_9CHLO|nr:subunit 4 of NADH-plastoquinoneoxidoreductase [Nephroselmis pyriformis]QSV37327.1 subunit 4 of NADH-plastoquinoneoxidoreductase [Nephroselmis pyriformis]
MTQFPWLTIIVLLPVLSALLIPLIPDRHGSTVRWYALGVSVLDLALLGYAFGYHYNLDEPGLQLLEDYEWIGALHLHWSVGADGLSMPLLLLTGFITTLATLAAWPVTKNPRLFYGLMLAMYSGQLGVFAAQDMLLFFLMWELELIPVYILVSIWGGKRRLYAATKFILYTALGSIFILVAGLSMAFYGGNEISFLFTDLTVKNYPMGLELLLYGGFLIAYGVKLPAFPVHTWLPDTHGEAHYSTCMLLAGILLKMGGYALIRINMQMLPHAHAVFAPFLIGVGIINILYAALTSLAQRNLKRKIAYSSVSHMGFVLIGIGSLTDAGLSGAMLQMISHGLIGASLFFLAGTTYDRTRTLILEELGGMAQYMPKTFAMFTACSMASLALPGMSGFFAELLVFLGLITSQAYSPEFRVIMTFFEAIGIILTPIYLLSMLRQVFYGPRTLNSTGVWSMAGGTERFIDAGPREVFVTASLLVPILGIGLFPKMASQLYVATTDVLIHQLFGGIGILI